MDSSGTKTSVRVTSAEEVSVSVGGISSNVAPRLGWELRGADCSAAKAGIGFGVTLEPDLLWRSLRVGLNCCLSLKAEKNNNSSPCACALFTGCSILPVQSRHITSYSRSYSDQYAVQWLCSRSVMFENLTEILY